MPLTTKGAINQIKDFWQTKSPKTKKKMMISTAAVIALAIAAALVINNIGYVVLYNGLSSTEVGQVVSTLDDMGADFRVKAGGTIYVQESEESQILMDLAANGYTHNELNYDIFSGNAGFMTTEYEKQQYLLFQLQNRLQDAIKTIKGVEGAIVTISLPDTSTFVLEDEKVPASASVVLDLVQDKELDQETVEGIELLVSKSVSGLESENVVIVSETGELLNRQYDENGKSSYMKLELEKTISSAIEQKVLKLLLPIFGYDSLRVAVNTQVDVRESVSEETTYQPVLGENGIVYRQDATSETVGSGDTASGVPGTESNADVTTYQETAGDADNSRSSESSSTTYLNNQLIEQVKRDGYAITDISVSILVGNYKLSAKETADYKEMVALAAGILPEKVGITSADFGGQKTVEPEPQEETAAAFGLLAPPNLYYLAGGLLGLIVIGVILLIVFKKRKKARKAAEPELIAAAPEEKKEIQIQEFANEIILNETREQNLKRQIKEFSADNPDIVAQLVRTWIKEDEGS